MALTPCPYCGAEIENDSYYCDQCGAELYICPKCHTFRKGKFCPADGGVPVKASELDKSSAVNQSPGPVADRPSQPVTPPEAPANVRPTTNPPVAPIGTPATAVPTKLVCRQLGIVLPLQQGAILGRVYGQYVPQLSVCQYMSGTHARVDCSGGTWTIADQKSTNGTMLNGIPCAPYTPMPIKPGDIIRFATVYDFYVE